MNSDPTINQLGEAGLLKVLSAYCQGIGDDAAVLPSPRGDLVITTDALVEGVHFSPQTTPANSVGWRAAAANLSDLAAMGADPLAVVVALGLPGSTTVAWVEGLYAGIRACCQPWGVDVVGGDLCRSATRFVAITAWGEVQPGRAMLRSAARAGDWLLVSGSHGDSRAGLELLLHPERGSKLTELEQKSLIQAHQFPPPRLDLVPMLQTLPDPPAGMDTSDGLADALIQICQLSGVGAVIESARILRSSALERGFTETALEWALYGGEDFELLLSLPEKAAQALLDQNLGLVRIGRVVPDPRAAVVLEGIGVLERSQSFQHFT